MSLIWIKEILKKYWLWILVGIAAIGAAVVFVLTGGKVIPSLEMWFNKIKEADLTAQTSKAIVKAKADSEREELERIKKISDGIERRKRLAEMLNRLSNG